MDIRKVTPVERIQYNGICTTVFFDMQRTDIRTQLKNPQDHLRDEHDDPCWGAFDEKGQLQSAIIVNSYNMMMNGREVKMGGIGGVVTRPESRGKGLIRRIMDKAFPAMVEEAGQTFSFLYPFSYSYYRNFGYEMCLDYNKVNIPMEEINGYPYPKNIQPFEPGDDMTPVMEIYKEFTQNRNLAIVRDKDNWEYILNRDPYKDLKFTFVNYDENGVANAYVLYNVQKSGNYDNRLQIRELCWRTKEGLHNIFGFFAKLSSEFSSVEWNAPCDVNVHALFSEAYNASWSINAAGMNRVVNVKAGLATLRAPSGSGKITLDVTDAYWKDNSGKYTIQWDAGNLTVAKGTSENVDMAVSVETLAQLVTGYMTPCEVALKKDVVTYSNHLALEQLFPKQRLFIVERF